MNKEFIPYEQALELKELGFDEEIPTFYSYPENKLSYTMDDHNQVSVRRNSQFGHAVSAPTFSQAFRWFRMNYRLTGLVETGTQEYSFLIFNENTDSIEITSSMNGTYEEAELACLNKLIDIVKNKKD